MHISDLKKFNKCHRLYQLSKQDSSEYFSFFNINIDIDDTIAKKLKINDYLIGSVGQSNEDTFKLLNNNNNLFKARFQYKDLRIKIPFLKKVNDFYYLYFYSLTTNNSNDDLTAYLYSLYVMNHLNLNVKEIYILYLNPNYVRKKELDCDQLWILSNKFEKHETSIIEEVKLSDFDVETTIREFKDDEYLYPAVRSVYCNSHRRCPYYDKCFPEELEIADNSILHLVSSQYKYKMYEDGIAELKNASVDLLEGNRVQYSQIMADKNGGLYLDKFTLKNWLNDNIKLPISFIDFEWDLFPIPPYHHMSPLQVLPFQYSLHVFDGKKLKHYEYIGKDDCREEMINSMLKNIPSNGTVIAYNAIGAEMMRISEMAFAFPKYKKQLEQINSRIVDLAYPFISGLVYDVRMAGSFTLKTIETIVDDEHSYADLDCNNGVQAIDVYRKYCSSETEQKAKEYYQQLFDYCGLDSYSLYKVYNWLKKLSDD